MIFRSLTLQFLFKNIIKSFRCNSYKVPDIFLLFGGFCLSWGGFIIRSFEEASVWQILFLRSFFFILALIFFLFLTYKKNTFIIIKESGLPVLFGGFVLSFSFVAFVVAMSNTTVANVVFIISTQTMFLAIFGYFYLKEKVSLIGAISIFLAMSGILIMEATLFRSVLYWKYCCFSYTY